MLMAKLNALFLYLYLGKKKVAIFALGEPIEFALLVVESKKPPVRSKGNPMRGRLSKQIVFIALSESDPNHI
jgi:hypothetical protein